MIKHPLLPKLQQIMATVAGFAQGSNNPVSLAQRMFCAGLIVNELARDVPVDHVLKQVLSINSDSGRPLFLLQVLKMIDSYKPQQMPQQNVKMNSQINIERPFKQQMQQPQGDHELQMLEKQKKREQELKDAELARQAQAQYEYQQLQQRQQQEKRDAEFARQQQAEYEHQLRIQMQQEESDALQAIAEQAQFQIEEQQRLDKDQEQNRCSICHDYLLQGEFLVLKTCKCVFHDECIRKCFEAQLDNGKIEIKCPNSALKDFVFCQVTLQHRDLHKVLSNEAFEKWSNLSIARAVDSAEDMSWCPTASCGYAFIKDDSELLCPKCNKHYCLDCRVEMHKNMTCIEYKADKVNRQDDSEVLDVIQKVIKAKQCGKCKFWVERNGGCNHMRCRCGNDFYF